MLWGKLKAATAAHLAAQAKLKAKHDLEMAGAAAQEERVALQQYKCAAPSAIPHTYMPLLLHAAVVPVFSPNKD